MQGLCRDLCRVYALPQPIPTGPLLQRTAAYVFPVGLACWFGRASGGRSSDLGGLVGVLLHRFQDCQATVLVKGVSLGCHVTSAGG